MLLNKERTQKIKQIVQLEGEILQHNLKHGKIESPTQQTNIP